MTYSEREIKEFVKKRKKSFFLKMIITLVLILTSCAVMIIFPEVTLIFFAVAIITLSVVYLIKTVRRYEPRVLFSKEIMGENIKEHEFVTTDRRLAFGARVIIKPRRRPNTFASDRRRTKPPTSAIVFLRTEAGAVIYLDGLTGAQTDIYEIGDTLYKYAGTRYPVIAGREVDSQPCPICGTANKKIETRCITCGLDIIDK